LIVFCRRICTGNQLRITKLRKSLITDCPEADISFIFSGIQHGTGIQHRRYRFYVIHLSYHFYQIVIQNLLFTAQPVTVIVNDTTILFNAYHCHGTVFHKLLVKAVVHADTNGHHDNNGYGSDDYTEDSQTGSCLSSGKISETHFD